MSTQLIDHNPDLKKLKDQGYNISIIRDHIVIKGVAYVNTENKVAFGSIFCPFNLSGNKITQQDHTVRFTGDYPCHQNGDKMACVINNDEIILREDIIGHHQLSSRPDNGYPDFYEKIKRYIDLLLAPAKSIDPSVRSKNFDHVSYEEDTVFKYPDTNSARAEITEINNKVKDKKIAIIGLGGTGSFILDYVSKTQVAEIALFDGDSLLNHNAFRIPGAVSSEELDTRQSKVSYLTNMYEKLRSGIVYFEEYMDETNVESLSVYDFVFIAIDDSKAKGIIVNFLIEFKIPFIDVGMGITKTELGNSLRGSIRKTMVTPENMRYFNEIPTSMKQKNDDDVYRQNIQLIELNALNAALAVIEWKKYFGFYNQVDMTHYSVFIIDQELINHGS